MTFKDDVRYKTGAFLTKSQEIFEKIFAQATRELRIKRKPKPAVQEPTPAPSQGTPRLKEEKAKFAHRPIKTKVPPKQSYKIKPAPAVKTKPRPRTGGGSRVLRVSLLIVLLAVLTGFLANHFAIVDLTIIPDLLGLGPKQVVQAPIRRKQPAKAPEKTVSAPNPSQSQEKVPSPSPAPPVTTPSSVSKEEKLVEIETPTTLAQSKPANGRVAEKVSSASTPVETKATVVAATREVLEVT